MSPPRSPLTKEERVRLYNIRHRTYKREWMRKYRAKINGEKYIYGLGKARKITKKVVKPLVKNEICQNCQILLKSKYAGKGNEKYCESCLK